MIGEFLARLAIVLPLVCGLAVVVLLAARRGWLPLPAFAAFVQRQAAPAAHQVELLSVTTVLPHARLAVVRFDGRRMLIGITPQSVALLTEAFALSGRVAPDEFEATRATAPGRQENMS
jgi:flagellar biogenesis protein FliO